MNEVYRFAAGRSPTEALEIGGGKPVALGSISKRIKTSQTELAGLNERINALKVTGACDWCSLSWVRSIYLHIYLKCFSQRRYVDRGKPWSSSVLNSEFIV